MVSRQPIIALLFAACLFQVYDVIQAQDFDLTALAQICLEQAIIDSCPDTAQFCTANSECPAQQICSCQRQCGNLTCMVPDNQEICGCHPVPRNGFIEMRADEVKFFCDEGYKLSGPAKKHCLQGKWNPLRDYPRCLPIYCPQLPAPVNGLVAYTPKNDERRYKSNATFSCNEGFTLVGDRYMQCKKDEQWTNTIPSCRRDGKWSDWSPWSTCDAQCGSGLKRRSRTCIEPEQGGRPCQGDLTSEVQVCRTGKNCETNRLNCYSSSPWQGEPMSFQFDHPALRGNVHRCLHHCKNANMNYGAVQGSTGCWCFNEYKRIPAVSCGTLQEAKPMFELYAAPQGRCTKQKEVIDRFTVYFIQTYDQHYTTTCGFWGWQRCNRKRTASRQAKRDAYRKKLVVVECGE